MGVMMLAAGLGAEVEIEIEGGGKEAAKRFSEEVFGVLFTVLLLITIVMELAMPLIVRPRSPWFCATTPSTLG